MNLHLVISVMISFLISVLAGPAMIPFLRKLKIGQTQREDGPSTHLKKSGTTLYEVSSTCGCGSDILFAY